MATSLGQAAYQAYRSARNKVLPAGTGLASWESLTPALRAAWEAAATAAVEECGNG